MRFALITRSSSRILILPVAVFGLFAGLWAGVELNPGTLEGVVELGNETIRGGSIYASSMSGFSSSSSFSGKMFSLIVEGNQDYRANASISFDVPGTPTYLSISRSTTAFVPVNGVGRQDFQYDTARIHGSITVVGGALTSYRVYASASATGEFYSANAYYGSAPSFSFPMIVDDAVNVYGNATFWSDAGFSVSLSFPARLADLTMGDFQTDWSFDLTTLPPPSQNGSVQGIIDIRNVLGPEIVRAHGVYAGGRGVSLSSNGPFQIDQVPPGNTSLYAYTNLDAPFGGFRTRAIPITVQSGQVTNQDIREDLGFIHSALQVTGFINNSMLSSSYLEATASGMAAWDYPGSDGVADFGVPPGDWIPYYFNFSARDFSDPLKPLNTYSYGYDYSRFHPYYGGTPITVGAGDDLSVPGFEVKTTRAEIIFDVVEPNGAPEVLISNPRISGSATRFNPQGGYIGYKSLYAYGPSQAMAKPSVQIVGEPGTYSVTAYGNVNGATVTFARFNLVLEPPIDTPPGTGVVVVPKPGFELEFENIIEGGVTTVTESVIGPSAPDGFRILSPGGDPIYYDISTTATFDGMVRVCINYNDAQFQPESPENLQKEGNLKLFHWLGTHWDDITENGTISSPNPDTAENRICGLTDSFSVFAIVIPDNVVPVVTSLEGPQDPVSIGTEITVTAEFVDPNLGDDHSIDIDWGDGSSGMMLISGLRTIEATHVYSEPGVYRIRMEVADAFGADSAEYEFVVVFDPEGGFVTGGGWIQSPAGALASDETLEGRANFGFVSKYKKGATVPSGQTQFQFEVGGLDFHSTLYDWLVVAGARAQFKGSGTINGSGNFGFLLTGIDGQVPGGGGSDRFRIKIWDRDNSDAVVYDNELGASDDADPATALGGGSIVVHSPKN